MNLFQKELVIKATALKVGDLTYVWRWYSRKNNKSDSTNNQILEKRGRQNHLVRTIGSINNTTSIVTLGR